MQIVAKKVSYKLIYCDVDWQTENVVLIPGVWSIQSFLQNSEL